MTYTCLTIYPSTYILLLLALINFSFLVRPRFPSLFSSTVQVDGVQLYLGVFDTELEAAEKYDEEATAHNKLSILNFSNCSSSQKVEPRNSTCHTSTDSGTDSVAETVHLRENFACIQSFADTQRERKIALGKLQNSKTAPQLVAFIFLFIYTTTGHSIKEAIDVRKELTVCSEPIAVLNLLNKLDRLKIHQTQLARQIESEALAVLDASCSELSLDSSDATPQWTRPEEESNLYQASTPEKFESIIWAVSVSEPFSWSDFGICHGSAMSSLGNCL